MAEDAVVDRRQLHGGVLEVGGATRHGAGDCRAEHRHVDGRSPVVEVGVPDVRLVADLAAVLEPERAIVIARELTKLHEQVVRLPLGEAVAWLASDPNHARGEFVLLIEGAPPREGLDPEAERVLDLLLAELPLKTAARLAAEITGQARNALYARALELKRG